MDTEFQLQRVEKVPEMGGDNGSITVWMSLMPQNRKPLNGWKGEFYVMCVLTAVKKYFRKEYFLDTAKVLIF